MDLTREYKNEAMERKRQKLLREREVAKLLTTKKARQGSVKDSIEKAFNSAVNAKVTPLSREIADAAAKFSGEYEDAFRSLLLRVESESGLLDNPQEFLGPLRDLVSWKLFWVRDPGTWRARSYNDKRCFSSLARHLLARYDVPQFMDYAFWCPPRCAIARERDRYQEWFIHIGQGQNIRKAPDFPIAYTKMQAHHFLQAPKDYTISEAIRWGQIRGLGGEERLVEAVIGTHMGRAFHKDEPFWATVLHWFVLHQTMDARQVGPIIDYIESQKYQSLGAVYVAGRFETHGPPQPNFSMKGRTPYSLIRQVEEWHKHLAKSRTRKITSWETCGISGFDRIEGDHSQKRYAIRELLTSSELQQEGRAMHHCAGSYSQSCASRRCAIYSLQANDGGGMQRRLTIEVDLHSKAIVQARGKYNATPANDDIRIMRAWAVQEGLTTGRWVRI